MAEIIEKIKSMYYLDEQIICRRNFVVSVVCGILFATAWWLMIDAAAFYGKLSFSYWICGIIGTISFIMVNSVTSDQLNGAAYEGGCLGENGSKIWLFIGFVLGFAAMIASVWIMAVDLKDNLTEGGIQFLIHNIFILTSSLLFKFGLRDNSLSSERF